MPLHLIGQDVADVPVISALLQDAAVRVADVHYDGHGRRLVLLANRYRWEAIDRTRVRSVLCIGGVLKASRKAWPANGAAVLELLSLRAEGEALLLDFAGGSRVRLEVECVDLLLEDLTGPWGATRTPAHPAE